MRSPALSILLVLMSAVATIGYSADIPLCQGLTVVTVISQPDGDYESIKTVESVGADRIRIKYASEAPNNDIFDDGPPLKTTIVYRSVLTKDLQSAGMYQQIFTEKSAELIPRTTAIGVSASVLHALKTKGESELTISNANVSVELTGDPEKRPNAYDFAQPIPIKRAGTVKLPVLVNDLRVDLPAIQAQGEALEEKYEFFILDDEKNPLMLKFRLGVGSVPPPDAATLEYCKVLKDLRNVESDLAAARYGCNRKTAADRDVLRVVKITYRCGGTMPPVQGGGGGAGSGGPGGGDLPGGGSQLEKQLAENRRADIYSIYFSFNSDGLRPESEPTLKEIADVMRKHPDWRLDVNGHTDNVASDDYNLKLSQRRAAAVKDALVKRYKVDASRLVTGGMGKAQPKDTNDTVEGRARNRRVELVRL
jgi:outer membrane protein OmpA-like peptidoglycan-associated protein